MHSARAAKTGAEVSELRLGRLNDWLAAPAHQRAAAVRACLARIGALEPQLHAWVQVEPRRPAGEGPLAGIPFGVKDTVETAGLVTEYGSSLYRGRIGSRDAAIVCELCSVGALLLGKTVTTPFAYRTPAATRNPRNLAHTPGGSSSGSAAAVAADMVPFSVGEQTLGSILRPASYCGVTGFKPTHGVLSTDGMLPLAPSLDTLGFFTQTPADMSALWTALGRGAAEPEAPVLGVPGALDVEPRMRAAFQESIAKLRASGAEIRVLDLTQLMTNVAEAAYAVLCYEAAQVHRELFAAHGGELGDLATIVREGLEMATGRYEAALQSLRDSRSRAAAVYLDVPFILTPAATGPAPAGLGSTGDPRMNAPWTALGAPAISLPMPVAGALPLGLQVTADRGQDARLLSMAGQLAAMLDAADGP
jgi:Asp-tRNA(Asn)/Glu-tRNA(Gln) amidotransferase A subunit family amidase